MRRRIALLLAALPLILALGWAAAGAVLAGGGCHAQVEAIPSEDAVQTVKLDGCTFAPTITRVPVGSEVRWINATGQAHDVTGRKYEWGSDQLNDGQSFTHRFTRAGLYPYSCSLHPGMAGVVVVGSSVAADVPDTAPVSATAPVTPAPAENSTVPYLAAGGIGLLAGLGVGAALVARRRRPA